ncbi:lipopolysaccharide biosynthesis protein [Desemzia sp. FAM 23990]|uniref:lipopolysaccharide biosynthesis protein n=1 Tax=Desemzia sp. FAM 23990 TaxID=3259520 RepID=UPI0038890DFF
MNSYKKLVGNSFIFAIGNLGSKLISLILVPLYTHYLSTGEYGGVDLVMTTASMFVPIVSAGIYEAVLRFIMDKNQSTDVIISNSFFVSVIGCLIAFLFYPILKYLGILGNNLLFLYFILLLIIFERVFSQYARATNNIKIFSMNGMLLTLNTGILNILFLVYFELGVFGYFLSIIFAYVISIVFLILTTKVYKEIRFSSLNLKLTKRLLNYSIPMVPNSLMWWVISASSRYFIFFFINSSANGLFAIASRIPALINIVNQVFTQAWQLSAIEEYENENKSKFYTNVFSYLSSIMFLGTSAIIAIVKVLFDFLFASEYYEAWRVVPFLLLGAVFSSFSGFFGTNYIAAKKTKGVFKTSVYGGITSMIFNLLLIPTLGIEGAGISSMASFFVMFVIRFFDTKQFIDIEINWRLFTSNVIIIFIQIGILMMQLERVSETIIEAILFIILLVTNRNLMTPIVEIIKSLKKRNK